MGRGTLLAVSSYGSLLLLLLLHFQPGVIIGASDASVRATAEKTCDKIVSVETVEQMSYLYNVTFKAPTPFSGRWKTVIKFTSPYTFIGGWGVEVQSFGKEAYAIFERKVDDHLSNGDLVVFQFRVLYTPGAKAPKVLSIRWQNEIVCGSP